MFINTLPRWDRRKHCRADRRTQCQCRALLVSQAQSAKRRARMCAPEDLIKRLMRSFEFQCQYCGSTGWTEHYWTVDRVTPQYKGGLYTADNVTLSCRRCNSRKGIGEVIGPVRTLADVGGVDVY